MRPTNENPLKDLIPLVIEGISKKHRNFYVQNKIAFVEVQKLFRVQNDRKVAGERIVWDKKSDKPGATITSVCLGHDHIQTKGDGRRIFNPVKKFESILSAARPFMSPFDYIYPLPRTSLLNGDLFFKMFGLRSDLSVLPQENADSPQRNQNSHNRRYQIKAIQRILCGIIGFFFIYLTGWLCFHRAVVADNLWGIYGSLFLAVLSFLVACVLCDISIFDGGDAWLHLWHSYAGG